MNVAFAVVKVFLQSNVIAMEILLIVKVFVEALQNLMNVAYV
jgi:hypothetical protein